MKKSISVLALILTTLVMAQEEGKLPYYEIPDYTESYSAGTVAARMIDGLGFRYFWATEGLRAEDLSYKPSISGRTSADTIQHLFELSLFILSTISESEIPDVSEKNFEYLRKRTLLNFKKASSVLRETDDLTKFDNEKYPFWNVINGPISDALWHCGQVVMLRRASGNPFNSKVSVFRGKLKD